MGCRGWKVVSEVDVRLVFPSGVERRQIGDLKSLLSQDGGVVWVDIPACDAEGSRVLSEVFGFHPRAVADCEQRNPVPKVHVYSDHVFVVLHAPNPAPAGMCTTSNWTSSADRTTTSPCMARSTRPSNRTPP